MKATQVTLLELLAKRGQFSVPIYQRVYSWEEPQCRQLWDDIIRAGRDGRIKSHFIGSIVYIKQDDEPISLLSNMLVIDGQQRLTTISLILEAFARQLSEGEEVVDGFSENKIRVRYLLNQEEEGEGRYKLLLSKIDKPTLQSLVDQKKEPKDSSVRIIENFQYFEKKIQSLNDGDKMALCHGLVKLMVVDIILSSSQDNPQLIFESMNSTGLDLSQADLIRNFILMGLKPKEQKKLYNDYWQPMEQLFGQEAYRKYFDAFVRHYLTIHTGEMPTKRGVYQAFKTYVTRIEEEDTRPDEERNIEDFLVSDLRNSAEYYCNFSLGQEKNPQLASAFSDLHDLKADVVYPLLLCLYEYYVKGDLQRSEMLEAVRLIESYVFRRAVCEISAAGMNKTFAALGRDFSELDGRRCLEGLKARFRLYQTYRRFPSDEEFFEKFKKRDLYNFMSRSRSRSYWLRRLENHNHGKEQVLIEECTIEHIMPQNPELAGAWRKDLGEDWKRIHSDYLHTLGNLTLTGYNSEYGDRPFFEKRDMESGFRDSPLWLNKDLKELPTWNEDEIKGRAERLAKCALEVWPYPDLSEKLLESYRKGEPVQKGKYSIEDFHKLKKGGLTLRLFDKLSKEVKAIDKSVRQEFTKHYIAYKAETNFVDVEPQTNRLSLIINLEFPELSDRRKLAIDITGRGKLGNGDVKVILESEEDIPYVMSLIRQAFDKQTSGSGLEE